MRGWTQSVRRGKKALFPIAQPPHLVSMSCKASLCLRCAKVYVANWVAQVSKMLHAGAIYRYIVLTVPAMLRTTFYQNAQALLSSFMRCGVCCLDDFAERTKAVSQLGECVEAITSNYEAIGIRNKALHVARFA